MEHKYYETRNRASDAIKDGKVMVDGKLAKASQKVNESSHIEIKEEKFYVSRAAKKLESYLHECPVDIAGKRVLDIGSSTGGFAQIILEHNPKELSCVDVGKGQLHQSILQDSRVSSYEETDIRRFDQCGYEVATCDVSFISVEQIMGDIERLTQKKSDIIILYKPQFEVGRVAKRDSKGVVMSQEAISESMSRFQRHAKNMGWMLVQSSRCKLSGKEGNQEYIFHFKKGVQD